MDTDKHAAAQKGPVGRAWDHAICCCCGAGDSFGWNICCLTYWCPCYVWGKNAHSMRASRSVGSQALLFLVLFGLFYFIYVILMGVSQTSGGSPIRLKLKDGSTYTTESALVSGAINQKYGSFGGLVPYPPILIAAWTFFGLTIFFSLVGYFVGFRRRVEIRQALNIAEDANCDNTCCDCLKWFFCPICALCQEARTLRVNSVSDGVCCAGQNVGDPKTAPGPYPATSPPKQVMELGPTAV